MITPDGKHCTITGVVVWDGVSKPETDTHNGHPKFSCKIAINPQELGLNDVDQLAKAELMASEFQGQLPMGATWPISPVNAADKFNVDGRFKGFVCMNAGTYQGQPQVFFQGQQVPAMQLGTYLYPGAVVELLVNFYSFNNKSKGVAAGLAGINVVDNTTPRLNIGGAGIDAASIFGGGAAANPVTGIQGAPAAGTMPQTDPNAAVAAAGAPIQQNVVQHAAPAQVAQGASTVGAAAGNIAAPGNAITPDINHLMPNQ